MLAHILFSFLLALGATPFHVQPSSDGAGKMRIYVVITPKIRVVDVVAQCEEFERRSGFYAEEGRSGYTVEWRGLPEGLYTVGAIGVEESGRVVQTTPRQLYVRR